MATGSSTPWASEKLSKREQQVLEMTSEGWTARDTAKELWLSVDTVKTYRKKLIRKLGARNIAHAVTIAFRRGLIS